MWLTASSCSYFDSQHKFAMQKKLINKKPLFSDCISSSAKDEVSKCNNHSCLPLVRTAGKSESRAITLQIMICWNSAQIIYREAEWQRLLLDNPFYICVSVQQNKLTVSHMQKPTKHSELLQQLRCKSACFEMLWTVYIKDWHVC